MDLTDALRHKTFKTQMCLATANPSGIILPVSETIASKGSRHLKARLLSAFAIIFHCSTRTLSKIKPINVRVAGGLEITSHGKNLYKKARDIVTAVDIPSLRVPMRGKPRVHVV